MTATQAEKVRKLREKGFNVNEIIHITGYTRADIKLAIDGPKEDEELPKARSKLLREGYDPGLIRANFGS